MNHYGCIDRNKILNVKLYTCYFFVNTAGNPLVLACIYCRGRHVKLHQVCLCCRNKAQTKLLILSLFKIEQFEDVTALWGITC